jgi:hypothetical protein
METPKKFISDIEYTVFLFFFVVFQIFIIVSSKIPVGFEDYSVLLTIRN